MRLILCRHGQTLWNTQRRTQGRSDIPLDRLGRAQAATLGARLKRLPITAVYASPLSRAYDTASAAGLPVTPDDRLLERAFGEWEGKRFSELEKEYPEIWKQWEQSPLDALPPMAETMGAVQTRCLDFLKDMSARHGENELVLAVSHSVPVRLMVAHVLGLSVDGLHRFLIDNASYTELYLNPRRSAVRVLNDTTHLNEIGVFSL